MNLLFDKGKFSLNRLCVLVFWQLKTIMIHGFLEIFPQLSVSAADVAKTDKVKKIK